MTGSARIGIAGAGVLGRLLAWQLSHAGHQVEVFDPAPGPEPRSDGLGPAGFTAAGMLSPLAELDAAGPEVATLGLRSVTLWAEVAQRLRRWTGRVTRRGISASTAACCSRTGLTWARRSGCCRG